MMATVNPAERGAALYLGLDAPAEPCVLVIFGGSGDLTKRLLVPALYNLACDGLLSDRFAIVGVAMDELTTESFRERLDAGIREFNTREELDREIWKSLVDRIHYVAGRFDDPQTFAALADRLDEVHRDCDTGGNALFYLAVPPSLFAPIARDLDTGGLKSRQPGWTRLVVEKPFGQDLESARRLNRLLLTHWSEDQIYRMDHYLGKETVQNMLAFRFSNRIFEPVWHHNFIDHVQLTVAEQVGVERRGRYYDKAGVLRDMIQNHMFQMLAYTLMEPPTSFEADAIRNEKVKLLDAVRPPRQDEIEQIAIRGQYGPGTRPDGSAATGYRDEPDVEPGSVTPTFAALKLTIDNWRWEGVPVYLRSGKSLWKRETSIVVQFKKAPEVLFANVPTVDHLEGNQLYFHIQPDQGIELRFQAKQPGPGMSLQNVRMNFGYGSSFQAERGTGYEVLLYDCMIGNATLFSRTDWTESAWRLAQPFLDGWDARPPQTFPNYPVGSWGPKASFELIERDGRSWVESISHEVIQRVPLFGQCDATFAQTLSLMLEPQVFDKGDTILEIGRVGDQMFFINRGRVKVLDAKGEPINELGDGDFFGEVGLLSGKRSATVRALTPCNLFVLHRSDFHKVLRDRPHFARSIARIAKERYALHHGSTAEILDDTERAGPIEERS